MWVPMYTVCEMGDGFLAVRARPESRHLEQECATMALRGVLTVVSLLEPAEAERLGLKEESVHCGNHGMRFHSHPVPDHGLPPDRVAFIDLARRLQRDIEQGQNTIIHCYAGIGRTGMLASCVLMAAGRSADQAIEQVSAARGYPVPDSEEQWNWICDSEAFFRGR